KLTEKRFITFNNVERQNLIELAHDDTSLGKILDIFPELRLINSNQPEIKANLTAKNIICDLLGFPWIDITYTERLKNLRANLALGRVMACLTQPNHPLINILSHAGIFSLAMTSPHLAYFVLNRKALAEKLTPEEKEIIQTSGLIE